MSHAPRIPVARARGPPLTHFIGLSLVTPASRPQLQASIETFRDAARNDKELLIPEPVAKFAIRPVDTLHLTICTLSLPEKEPERLQEVISHLKELDLKKLWQEAHCFKTEPPSVLDVESAPSQGDSVEPAQAQEQSSSAGKHEVGKDVLDDLSPLRVTLKGVDKFRSASKTTVVYAPPDDPTGSLQRFAESIHENFRTYLPLEVPKRPSQPETTELPPQPASRPTLESFPHPDSYKSDISVPSTPAPQPSTENVPLASVSAKVSPDALSGEAHISKHEQKKLAKEEAGELPHLILHATLLNTIYVRKHNRKDRRPVTIDARPLLERFKDTVWMKDVQIEKLCLFRMGAKEVLDENGQGTGIVRYVAEAERDLDF